MKYPPIQTFDNGLMVKYFEHKGKLCVMTDLFGKEKYTVFDSSPWFSKEEFYERY